MLCARLKNRFSLDLSNHESPTMGLYPDPTTKRKRIHSTCLQILDPQVKPIGKAAEGGLSQGT